MIFIHVCFSFPQLQFYVLVGLRWNSKKENIDLKLGEAQNSITLSCVGLKFKLFKKSSHPMFIFIKNQLNCFTNVNNENAKKIISSQIPRPSHVCDRNSISRKIIFYWISKFVIEFPFIFRPKIFMNRPILRREKK